MSAFDMINDLKNMKKEHDGLGEVNYPLTERACFRSHSCPQAWIH